MTQTLPAPTPALTYLRSAAAAWGCPAGSPLTTLATSGAIDDVDDLLAELDLCQQEADRRSHTEGDLGAPAQLAALRAHVLAAGERPPVPGWGPAPMAA